MANSRLNPFESGSVFKQVIPRQDNTWQGLNPFESGSVFKRGNEPLEFDLEVLIPLSQGLFLNWFAKGRIKPWLRLNPFESGSVFKYDRFQLSEQDIKS